MKYRIRKDTLWRAVDGEVVLVGGKTGSNCYLNRTGSEVWQMISKGFGYDMICRNLAEEYSACEKEIQKDIKNIIDDLVSSKFIERII